ncbi:MULTISPECIES: ATP-dependent Clp protease proteolytic subunit [Hallerella]|uniref:ATP-dependent Clp protease proteolytic subunit n=1 Tax=Hallerella TaxID=2815788 RepID=UPI0025859FB9|nr:MULTISPECIES: ATP-dependent Clp protease proteolytic subunit [Hallerella]MBS7391032.1 ATP-dependent Clp protease proteolytic subunit [Fibrobacter sp.]MCI6873849.1 ATP-dependent Clp protease proteolytic subunit [Hallerella sp.]MDY5029583.1 ATP-dependent Clp protease proteolytic subunit [Hallerella succinigenes]
MNAAKKAEKEQEKEQMPDFMKKAEEYFSNNRKIFLWNQVDDESAGKIVKQLLYLDSLSHDDIVFFINSPGGVISSGLAIYDAMNAIESDVVTVCCGQAASMGAVLLTAGAKGKRYAWPSARIMIHQPLIQGQMEGPASDIKIQAEEMLRIRSITTSIIAKTSGKTIEEVDRDTERDNFMSADEAKAYGLIDEVKSIL